MKNNSPLQNWGIPHENGNSSSCTVLVTLTSFSFWLAHSLFSFCFPGHRDANMRAASAAQPCLSPPLLSAATAWEKHQLSAVRRDRELIQHGKRYPASLCFAHKSSPRRKENRAGSLAECGHEGWECSRATLLRGESPPPNLWAKMNSGLGKMFAKMEKQSPAAAAA